MIEGIFDRMLTWHIILIVILFVLRLPSVVRWAERETEARNLLRGNTLPPTKEEQSRLADLMIRRGLAIRISEETVDRSWKDLRIPPGGIYDFLEDIGLRFGLEDTRALAAARTPREMLEALGLRPADLYS